MNIRLLLIGLVLILTSTTVAFAKSNCAQNNVGNIVCAPPGGSIMKNKNDNIVCSPGQCVVNKSGILLCSTQPGGSAFINDMGSAICAGVCVSPSEKYCKGAR